ncbi:hypothetical protein GF324_13000 [bacterium]|nr:hypothetical protein [bacterium]
MAEEKTQRIVLLDKVLNRMRSMYLEFIRPLAPVVKRSEGLIAATTASPAWTDGNAVFNGFCPREKPARAWWNAVQLQFQLKGTRPKSIRFADKDTSEVLEPLLDSLKWESRQETAWIHTLKDTVGGESGFRLRWSHPYRDKSLEEDMIRATASGRSDLGESSEAVLARQKALVELAKSPNIATCLVYENDELLLAGGLLRKRDAGFILLHGFGPLETDGNGETMPTLTHIDALAFFYRAAAHLAARAGFKGLGLLSQTEVESEAARLAGFRAASQGTVWYPPQKARVGLS